ncbi:phosphoenolpyruvate--protein phosphotransferase [Taklimakanibacter deserti]|uniref:phosphoenolpyruvate--protein phosphotransferase n=1 Tax=Taklimakanibacter deserti TaxID=2267839 RepID=UPI000E65DEB6
MVTSALGPRVLLRRLREVMAEPEAAQKRLDKIVVLIAANMVAEVCSIYVMRPGQVLELYSTEGLKREAVHLSKLNVGEGLVGIIAGEAQLLNLADAQAHPAFKYLPETGEEVYNSFLGVPILRNGIVIGVLVVQNRTRRHYTEEEEEALQTTAMVLAEIIASGELTEVARDVAADIAHVRSHHVKGDALADGLALGHVVLHEPRVVVENLIAENIPKEKARLDGAIEQLRAHVDELVDGTETRGGEYSEVLETFRMFAHDRGWVNRLRETVETGLTAEAAVERVQSDNRARMMRTPDPYLRERMHDLDDLANRLLRILTGQIATASRGDLPQNAIVVARNMGPAELLDYDRTKLRGVILEEAGTTSHVAIVARALGIPAAGQVEGLIDVVDTGTPIILDGTSGDVYVRPSLDIERAYADKVRFNARRQAQFQALRDTPAMTRDGIKIELGINAGLLVDLPHLHDSGAESIGLFRTELQFMMAQHFPRLDAQVRHYRGILAAANQRQVTFRTLDIGADKLLPYLRQVKEDNPAMGWRAIRMALDRPALLRLQLRALLKAGAGQKLRIMFPMIAEVTEFLTAKTMVEKEKAHLKERGHKLPVAIELGAMIEVPALVWQLDELLPELDFVSIGSNDLLQFLYASDRQNPRLAHRYDPLSPAILKTIRAIVEAGAEHGVHVNLCGEMAGRPLEAMALIGLGLTSISMAPAAIGPVKTMILSTDRAKLWAFMEPLLHKRDQTLRLALTSFAKSQGIRLI